MYYSRARYYNNKIGLFYGGDQLTEDYPSIGGYVYCAANPIKYIDPDGRAWEPTKDENNGKQTGYRWILEDQSYNNDGTLKAGLYHQAIFFSHNGTHDSTSDFNMGSSTAFIYKADGSTESFQASTHPARLDLYATVPEGMYEAKVGMHNGAKSSYRALRMSDTGTTDFDNSRIELGVPNPAFSDGRTHASGINIHKAGIGDKTGLTLKGSPISAGCSLIPISSWKDFIGIFDTADQRSNIIGVTMSRTYSEPSNRNIYKAMNYNLTPHIAQPDATRVSMSLQLFKIF